MTNQTMERYWNRLTEATAKKSTYILNKFFEFCQMSPDAAVEWQKQHPGDYRFVDLAIDWLREQKLAVSSKKGNWGMIKGFFLANRAPLPAERYHFKSEVRPTLTELSVEELKTILNGSGLNYRAAYLMAFQAGLGRNEVKFVSDHLVDHVFSEVKKGAEIIRLDIPGRKSKRNITPYYTFIGHDAIEVLRQLFESRGWKKHDSILENKHNLPMTNRDYTRVFRKTAMKTGLIKQNSPKCPTCGKTTITTRGKGCENKNRHFYYCDTCDKLRSAKEFGREKSDCAGIRYRVKSHEIRDLFRTEYHRAQAYNQADPVCAEFFMGHTIDPLAYDKIMTDKNYPRIHYKRALPWLNILSEDPRKIDRCEVEDQLESQRVQSEATSKRLVELEKKLRLLESPELRKLLKQLEDE